MTRMAIVIEFDVPGEPTEASKAIFREVERAFDKNDRFGVPKGEVHMFATIGTLANAVMTPIELHRSLVPGSTENT